MAVSFLIIFLTLAEVYLSKLGDKLPITNNILIYGLININIILLLLVAFLVIRNVVKLLFERKRRVFGSKLRTKLVVAFISLSLVPTLLLFWVSVSFIIQSIERWFSAQVENSLKQSLEVAQVYYQNSADNAIYYAKQLSRHVTQHGLLNEDNLPLLEGFIKQKQGEYNLGVVEVFSAQLEELVKAMNPQIPVKEFIGPKSKLVREGIDGKEITNIEPLKGADLIRGIVPIYSTWKKDEVVGAVVVNYYIPRSLVGKMKEISGAFEGYKQLKMLKNPIKLGYLIILSTVTLLIIFGASWFGFYLAKGITVPIQELAEGTHKVAEGNLNFQIDIKADDEIATLVNSFNKMTQDLKLGKQRLEEVNIDLERRRKYTETILKDVAAGVISLDSKGKVSTINKSAERMLGLKAQEIINRNYQEILLTPYKDIFSELMETLRLSPGQTLERQVRLSVSDNPLTLLVRATNLMDENGNYLGLVLVFENLTQLEKAQRVAAWREVARRIAHEIKNPLTPIQLSAQRLRKRYLEASTSDGKLLDECTKIIIDQVEELKGLVNEFSDFARLPQANPRPNDLNKIISEVLILFSELHKNVKFEFKAEEIPILNLDKEQIKRAIINLLDNAVAAIEKEGEVTIEASYDKVFRVAGIKISDTGCGISPEIKPKLFEPYFSTKKGGTGLGLAICKTIIQDHNGYIRVKDNHPKGSQFIIELPNRI